MSEHRPARDGRSVEHPPFAGRFRIDAERLRGFLDCMHAEADERDKHSRQIGAIVRTAKEAGYDTKAVRKVFVRERMDEAERSRQDDLLETYETALGAKGRALRAIADGVPVGEAAAANGVHRATVARARHVAKQPSNATPARKLDVITPPEVAALPTKPPHDPETGEITNAAPQARGSDVPVQAPEPLAEGSVSPQPVPDGGELGSAPIEDDLALPPFLKGSAKSSPSRPVTA